MTAAQQFRPHYTVNDYQGWEGDWELWNGIAVSMSPSPFGNHQMVLVNLVAELRTALRAIDCNATVLCEIDWIISRDTVVRPDALVVCGSVPEGHVETIPTLVAEILSPSTAERDRTHKRDLYDNAGVETYLILDPQKNTVETYLRTDAGLQATAASKTFTLKLCQDCKIQLDPDSFFTR